MVIKKVPSDGDLRAELSVVYFFLKFSVHYKYPGSK